MERSVYRISLDIRDSIGACQPEMKQGDTHRRLCINLTDGGVPYPIRDGCRVVFTAKKPDGTVIYNTCAVENNTVIYDITPQTTSSAGILGCELQLYDGLADPLELITSAAFAIRVHPRVYNENDIPASEAESTGISAMLQQAEQAIEALSEAKESGEFDGMPATHQWNGTVLTVTSASGTSSADLKGEKGDPGALALDDTAVGSTGWSSKHILDRLCPAFAQTGSAVRCQPVENYPLEAFSQLAPTPEGLTALTLTRCGKNLFDRSRYPFSEHYIHHRTGNQHGSSGYSATLDYIPCAHLRGQTITLNHPGYEKLPGTNAGIAFYTQQNIPSYISGIDKYTGQVPENANFMRFSVPREYADGTRVQIELGDQVTEFAPYSQSLYDVQLHQDLHGGSFDWNTGLLTVTHQKVDMWTLDWQYNEDNCYFYAKLPGVAEGSALCSHFTQAPGRFEDITTGGYGFGEPDRVFDISDGAVAVICLETDLVDTFTDILIDSGATLVYPLAEPYVLEYDSHQIPAAAGVNILFDNTGSIRVIGRTDPVATLEALTNAILSLGGNI